MQDPWQFALRLHLTHGLGLRQARLLVKRVGGLAQVWQTPNADLRDMLGLRLGSALGTPPPDWDQAQALVRHWLDSAPDGQRHRILTWGDTD